jgi:hypothetical protein
MDMWFCRVQIAFLTPYSITGRAEVCSPAHFFRCRCCCRSMPAALFAARALYVSAALRSASARCTASAAASRTFAAVRSASASVAARSASLSPLTISRARASISSVMAKVTSSWRWYCCSLRQQGLPGGCRRWSSASRGRASRRRSGHRHSTLREGGRPPRLAYRAVQCAPPTTQRHVGMRRARRSAQSSGSEADRRLRSQSSRQARRERCPRRRTQRRRFQAVLSTRTPSLSASRSTRRTVVIMKSFGRCVIPPHPIPSHPIPSHPIPSLAPCP